MKKFFCCITLIFSVLTIFAQAEYDSIIFNNSLILNDGIYTSLNEIKSNKPKYPNCELEIDNIQNEINIDELYYIQNNRRSKFESNLYATVINGKIYLFYKNKLNPIFLKAAICTFMIKEKVNSRYNNSNESEIKITMYFLDYATGLIAKVNKETLRPIITRDPGLADSFKKIKNDPNNKKSLPFISKYNERHKVYIITYKKFLDE